MKNKDLFEKTISILVKAYQNDTLVYTSCSACAVGNLVADANGIEIVRTAEGLDCINGWSGGWANIIELGRGTLNEGLDIDMHSKKIKQLLSTGYTLNELALVEKAFLDGTRGNEGDEANFNGLMAVCETLMQIHEATPEETEAAKLQFVR